MKKSIKLALAASCVALFSTSAFAQNPGNPASETGHASILVMNPIYIEESNEMAFPDTPAHNTDPTPVDSSDDGTFTLTGHPNTGYDFAASIANVADSCNAPTVVELTSVTADANNGTFDANGDSLRSVSGVMTVYGGAAAGTYNCTYSVSANY